MTSLLNLAPDIQEEILFLRCGEAKQFGISEPALRKLTATLLWNQQREQSRQLRRSVQAVRIDVEASILRSKPTLQDVTDGQNTRPSRS
jgi:hypothetical protein